MSNKRWTFTETMGKRILRRLIESENVPLTVEDLLKACREENPGNVRSMAREWMQWAANEKPIIAAAIGRSALVSLFTLREEVETFRGALAVLMDR